MHKLLMFNDEKLLRRSLTHRSYVNENPGEVENNERLEFLGDAILNFISGEYLYQLHPEMGEDEMTRRRAALVDEKQLARFAIEVGLDFRMRLGQGAISEGGYQNPNLLSSTFESVIAAYYLDKKRDIEALRPLVEQLFDSVTEDVMIVRSNIDSKNKFQELAQANGAKNPPKYVTEKLGGTDHAPEFFSKVYVDNKLCGEGKGRRKKDAEKKAAEDAIAKFNENTTINGLLCPKCRNINTIEHNGGQWCPNCAKFVTPPTSRHSHIQNFHRRNQNQASSSKTILNTCSCCGQKVCMGDGLYDDGEWICGGCLSGMAYPR